jgi:hypothetical protein
VTRLPATLLALQLAQKILRADQVVVEDLTGGLEKAPNERVAQRVPDVHTFLPARDNVCRPKHGELL